MNESVLIKFDYDLNLEWQQCYGGSLHEFISSVTCSQNGYYASHTAESDDGDLINSGFHGENDIWLTNLDSIGNIKWGKCYGGTSNEMGLRIFTETNGDIIIFGITFSNDGDIQGIHSPASDIWVLRIDTTGEVVWQQCIGGIGKEYLGIAVKKIETNSYIVAAETLASFGTGDIDCNTTAVTGYDIWFFKVTDTTIVSRNENKILDLKIFPNPTKEYLIIKNDKLVSGYFYLYNLVGQKVIVEIPLEKQLHVDLSDITPGIYLYTIKDLEGNFTGGKLIIN